METAVHQPARFREEEQRLAHPPAGARADSPLRIADLFVIQFRTASAIAKVFSHAK